MDKKSNIWYHRIWREGICLDFWSINHTLAGALAGAITGFFSISFWHGLIGATILMICWEIYEHYKDIDEPVCNRVMDVFVGILGFILLFYVIINISLRDGLMIATSVFIIWTVLQIWGYYSYGKIH